MNITGTSTYKEIMQQKNLWDELRNLLIEHKVELRNLIEEKKQQGHIKVYFSGAGSSAYVGDVLANFLKDEKEISFHSTPTTDIVTEPEKYFTDVDEVILFSFARSGNSPETKGTIHLANQISDNVSHVLITNNKDGYLANYDGEALKVILPEESNDKSLAMTSSFSTMLLSALLLFDKNVSDTFIKSLPEYFKKIENFVDKEIENEFKKVFYLATGTYSKISKETALKMNELTGGKIDVNNETTLGFRHGPKAALTGGSLLIQMYSQSEENYIHQYEKDITSELADAHDIFKVILTPSRTLIPAELRRHYSILELGEGLNNIELKLLYLVFGQLLACKKSNQMNINPDNPSPDGFINRVVKGVEIYDYN